MQEQVYSIHDLAKLKPGSTEIHNLSEATNNYLMEPSKYTVLKVRKSFFFNVFGKKKEFCNYVRLYLRYQPRLKKANFRNF